MLEEIGEIIVFTKYKRFAFYVKLLMIDTSYKQKHRIYKINEKI